jgi:hypothetical protein
MRVGILSQYYPRDGRSAGAALGARSAADLAGDEVVVLTALPNYPQGRIFPGGA